MAALVLVSLVSEDNVLDTIRALSARVTLISDDDILDTLRALVADDGHDGRGGGGQDVVADILSGPLLTMCARLL